MREASTVPEGTCSSTAIVTTPARRSTTVAAASIVGGALSGMTSMRSPVLGPRGFDDASATDALAAMSSRPASERAPTACTAAAFESASRSRTSASEYPVADGRTLEPASDAGAAAVAAAPPSAARTDTPDGSMGCARPSIAATATCSSNRTVSVPAPRSSTGDDAPDSREGGLSSGITCTVRLASAAWLPYRSSTAPAGAYRRTAAGPPPGAGAAAAAAAATAAFCAPDSRISTRSSACPPFGSRRAAPATPMGAGEPATSRRIRSRTAPAASTGSSNPRIMSPSARLISALSRTGAAVSFVTVTGASPSDPAAFPARSARAPADMFSVRASE